MLPEPELRHHWQAWGTLKGICQGKRPIQYVLYSTSCTGHRPFCDFRVHCFVACKRLSNTHKRPCQTPLCALLKDYDAILEFDMLAAQVIPKALTTSQAHFCRAAFVRGLRAARREVLSMSSISGGGTSVWCSRRPCLCKLWKETLQTVLLITGDSGSVRLVLIGDVHHQWDEQDVIALKHLQPDVALFVGDFGEEVVELVQTIKQQVDAHNIPAAYVLGNHDAW